MHKNSRVKSDNDLISVSFTIEKCFCKMEKKTGSGFRLTGSGLAPGAARPLIVDESFARQLGVRS